jgi:hypothetical protein
MNRPQTEDLTRAFLAMPLTKDLKLKRRKPPKKKLNEVFDTKESKPLEPVCKRPKMDIKKYEVRHKDKGTEPALLLCGDTPLTPLKGSVRGRSPFNI